MVAMMCQRNICITLSGRWKTWTCNRFLLLSSTLNAERTRHPWKRKQSSNWNGYTHAEQRDSRDSGDSRCQCGAASVSKLNLFSLVPRAFATTICCDKTKICVFSPPQSNTAAHTYTHTGSHWKIAFIVWHIKHTITLPLGCRWVWEGTKWGEKCWYIFG